MDISTSQTEIKTKVIPDDVQSTVMQMLSMPIVRRYKTLTKPSMRIVSELARTFLNVDALAFLIIYRIFVEHMSTSAMKTEADDSREKVRIANDHLVHLGRPCPGASLAVASIVNAAISEILYDELLHGDVGHVTCLDALSNPVRKWFATAPHELLFAIQQSDELILHLRAIVQPRVIASNSILRTLHQRWRGVEAFDDDNVTPEDLEYNATHDELVSEGHYWDTRKVEIASSRIVLILRSIARAFSLKTVSSFLLWPGALCHFTLLEPPAVVLHAIVQRLNDNGSGYCFGGDGHSILFALHSLGMYHASRCHAVICTMPSHLPGVLDEHFVDFVIHGNNRVAEQVVSSETRTVWANAYMDLQKAAVAFMRWALVGVIILEPVPAKIHAYLDAHIRESCAFGGSDPLCDQLIALSEDKDLKEPLLENWDPTFGYDDQDPWRMASDDVYANTMENVQDVWMLKACAPLIIMAGENANRVLSYAFDIYYPGCT